MTTTKTTTKTTSKVMSGFAQLGMCQCMGDFRRTKDCPRCGRKLARKEVQNE